VISRYLTPAVVRRTYCTPDGSGGEEPETVDVVVFGRYSPEDARYTLLCAMEEAGVP
jgi:hypothetical protein